MIAVKRIARSLFAVGLVGSVLALGSIHLPVLAAIAATFAASAWLAWRGESAFRLRRAAGLLVLLAISLTAYTTLQAAPLPLALARMLTPANARVWSGALAPLSGAAPSWVTLSLDPTATRVEVLRGLTYLAALVAALRFARDREGGIFLERLILASAVALAAAALLHPAFGAERVFGIYKPVDHVAERHIAPLLNANHLAGYVDIGICLAAAMALSPRPHLPRVLTGGAALLLVVVEIWIASRGGVGSMVVALLLVAGLSWAMRRTTGSAALRLSLVLTAGLVVASLAVFVLVGSEAARTELTIADLSKLQMFRQSMRVVDASPVFGVGRGAFATVFPAFRSGAGDFTFVYPENLLAQWSAEWGVPATVLALGVCAWALRPATVFARSRPPVGAWAALACLFVHNLVDFSSEVPGVVVALVTCAALVTGGEADMPRSRDSRRAGDRRAGGEREGRDGEDARSRRLRWSAWAAQPRVRCAVLAVATGGALLGCLPAFGHDVDEDGAALRSRVLTTPADRQGFELAARADMLRHPAEPYFAYLGALRAIEAQDASPLPWIARALERAQVYGRAHLLLARALYRRSPSQARLEYRLAYQQDPSQVLQVAREAPRLVSSYEDARELVSDLSPSSVQVLAGVSGAIAGRLPATAARLDADVASAGAAEDSVADAARARLTSAAIADLSDEAATWCLADRPSCLRRAHLLVDDARAHAPDSCRSDTLAAELAGAEGDLPAAQRTLERAVHADADGAQCVGSLIALATRETDPAKADELLERIGRVACESDEPCVPALLALAAAEAQRGRAGRAFAFTKQAYDRDASDEVLADLANAASAAEMHGEALSDFRKLSVRHPDDPTWKVKAENESNLILSSSRKALSK